MMIKGGCIYGYKKNFDGQTEKSARVYCQISEGAWILTECQGPVCDDRGEVYVYGACAAEGIGRERVYREDEGVSEDALRKGEGVTGAERAAEEMEIEELRQAISELSQKDRELLKMRFWDSMTHQEIAEVIGTSVQNINKCRQRLYVRLGPAT